MMAWVVLSAGSVRTPLSRWSWLLAVCVLGLSLLQVRLGAAAMGVVCTLQMLSLNGLLGVATAFLSVLFVVLCEQGGGRWFAVLAAPYLLRLGLGVAAPLGLALAGSRRTAWFWALVAFLWCVLHGLAMGQARLGVAVLPRFSSAPAATATTAAGRTPAASRSTAKPAASKAPAANAPAPFSARWFRAALAQAGTTQLRDAAREVTTQAAKNVPVVVQMVLWCAIASLARGLYVHRRVKDRVAMEYLEKVTRHAAPRIPPHRQLPGALAAGTLAFVVAYIILAAAGRTIQYGAVQAVLDVVSAALLVGPLWVIAEGDAHAGQHSAAERRAERRAEHGAAFRDLPVGEGGTHRPTAGHATARVPTAGATNHPHRASPEAHFGPAPAAAPTHTHAAPASATVVAHPAHAPTATSPTHAWTPPTQPASRVAPPRAAHAGPGGFAVETIVFIDMVGSTAMGSKYGDEYVLRLKEQLGDIVGSESQQHGALFSKGTGDGFMLTFPEADDAVFAAANILRQLRQANAGLSESRAIHLRIGVHMGQVNIDSHGDRIGTAANFAARIEGVKMEQLQAAEDPANVVLPERDRLLVSDVIHEELKDNTLFKMRPIGYFEFKGISGLHRIFEVHVS